jgi:prevent-host-death family protein
MSRGRSVGVRQANTQFSQLLREVGEGHEITVTRDGAPVARIVPITPSSRVADSRGMFAGRFCLPDDFDRGGDELGDLFGLPR